ncbi:MAG: T9SS type A sorting domain-containing protein, partial [candidate division WOR-3 bacterium]
PQPLSGSGCASVGAGDSIYVIGGRDSPGNRYATNYKYDVVTDNWTVRTSMYTPRAHLGCAVVDGKIYAIGGWVGSMATGAVEEYDPATDTWAIKSPMPTPRYTFCIASVGGKIYVFGGMNMQGQIFNVVEEYDPATDTWTTKTPMPTPRMGPGCAVVNDTVYVYGGSTVIGGGLTAVNECYDPVSDSWGTRASMPNARYAIGGFAWGDKVHAIGGYDYVNYSNDLDVFYPPTNTWEELMPMQNARQSIAVACVFQGSYYAYVIGGWNNGALNYNEEGWFEIGIDEHANTKLQIAMKVSPNPFSDFTEISFAIDTDNVDVSNVFRPAEVNVYDATGRLVGNLSNQISATGDRATVRWNGYGDRGQMLPTGAYLLVLKKGQLMTTEKILLIR